MNLFAWLESLPVSQAILTSIWLHPYLLAGHSIGMGVVVGIIFMLSLRALGYARGIPIEMFAKLAGLGWAGFALNLVTGVLMFMAYAHVLATNWTFDVKMICILAGGLSLWVLSRSIKAAQLRAAEMVFTRQDKLIAVITMVFWLGAIATGRLIAYTAPEGV